MLKFEGRWRYYSPGAIAPGVVDEFRKLIDTICGQGKRWNILEHFKSHFASAAQRHYAHSSSEDWASSDLDSHMGDAAENAPLFIEAFYEGCLALQARNPNMVMPDLNLVNGFLNAADTGFQIDPPNLIATREHIAIPVPDETPSLDAEAHTVIEEALQASERLLEDGDGRRAVQEVLWLLETVSTAFRDEEFLDGSIHGDYFNKIVAQLRRHCTGHQDKILRWMMTLHGYLSAPKGGGVRHGVDLKEGLELSINEARLFCNLIRSYLTYLISEHERLSRDPPDQ